MMVINLDLKSVKNKTDEEWFELWLQESKFKNYNEWEKSIKQLWEEINKLGKVELV